MRYILDAKIALRSWRLVPYAYYVQGNPFAKKLNKEEFEFLLFCDGKTELDNDTMAETMLKKGFIHLGKEKETLSEWQEYRNCPNRYFPKINWMITGRCNYNCLHCFNAADNSPSMSEWSMEEAYKLLDEAKKCGVSAFTITGGEPMIHKNFMEIMEGIYERGMFVDELNTNGYFLNREILDHMRKIGMSPLMKISFDGIGHHDWLRNRKGAQEDALRAIRLCKECGFRVMVQTNVHRNNLDTLLDTAKLMNSLGVETMRIIRTTEAPRWVENAGNATLGITEYYDRMLEFAKEYIKTDCTMDTVIWQFMVIHPGQKNYSLIPVLYSEQEYRDSLPVCKGTRGMVAIAANGNVYPCNQMSGYYEYHHDILGNVKSGSLQDLLTEGKYLCEVCTTVDQVKKHDGRCAKCRFFKHCAGGCRAIALALTGDKLAADPSKCDFFNQEYYEKAVRTMDSYKNLTCI